MVATPARGCGIPFKVANTGAPLATASSSRLPPPVTAMSLAPRPRAALVASRVSSVSPENDTANTRVLGPTNAGSE